MNLPGIEHAPNQLWLTSRLSTMELFRQVNKKYKWTTASNTVACNVIFCILAKRIIRDLSRFFRGPQLFYTLILSLRSAQFGRQKNLTLASSKSPIMCFIRISEKGQKFFFRSVI